jgi:hypothetical protein
MSIIVYCFFFLFVLCTDHVFTSSCLSRFKTFKLYVKFDVLTAASTKMAVFWVVALCSPVAVYRRFRGACCLHHQGDYKPPSCHSSFSHVTLVCQVRTPERLCYCRGGEFRYCNSYIKTHK